MSSSVISPFAIAAHDLRIKETAAVIHRPTKEEVKSFPDKAEKLIENICIEQSPLIEQRPDDFQWIEGRHFLIAGGTGAGLGSALANAFLHVPVKPASLMIISRDPHQSVAYETGNVMQRNAAEREIPFYWSNRGVVLEGQGFEKIIESLKKLNAKSIIYINTVAAASSGLLPGIPPVFVKDIDEQGLFQWRLGPLSDMSIKATSFIMGYMAVQFPEKLNNAGIYVDAAVFADWRGSLDRESRNPHSDVFARQGPYSTSLYLPKDIIQKTVSQAYEKGQWAIDFFFPTMKTRALSLIPGGNLLPCIYDTLMNKSGIKRKNTPELALLMLQTMGDMFRQGIINPFPRLDSYEECLDLWLYEVIKNLNDNENSDFYYKRWIEEM